jgi:PAS domain S-box-containing protein
MDLAALSNQQLTARLRELQEPGETPAQTVDRLQETVHDLQVHRVELEMQNRALRETQSELECAIRRYTDFYDHLPVGYVTVTPEGQILHANVAAAELLQGERARMQGARLASFVDAYDAGRLAAHLENCATARTAATLDVTLRLPAGRTMAVQFSSRLAPEVTGEPPQINIAITDVSKLKQAQRVLEDINREQEAFNYSISHDLRAPLVTINNYASIILDEHAEQLDDDGRNMVSRIHSAAKRMEDTLKNLLEFSSLAREDVVLEPVNTEDAIRDLLIEHRALIEQAKADVQLQRPLPAVRVCRQMFNQVLANLLTNALKYTRPGTQPSVTISAEPIETKVVLRVVDQGIGIDPQHRERIFRIFERLHGYSRYPGSGIGLAIARRAMERMNGRIWCESEPGKGSCFCLELPKA